MNSERMSVEDRVKMLANQDPVEPVVAEESPATPETVSGEIPDDVRGEPVAGDLEPVVAPEPEVAEESAPDPKSEKANEMWKNLKAKAKLAEEYKAQLEARSETSSEELDKLRADLEAERVARQEEQARFDDEYGKIDITRQRSFKREHDDKLNQSLHWMTNVLMKREGMEKDSAEAVVRKAFSIGDYQQRAAYLMDEAPSTQALLDNELMKADALRERRADAIQNWRATQEQLKEVDARLAAASTNQNVKQTLDATVEELRNSGNYYYNPTKGTSPGSLDWNRNLDTRITAVHQILLKQDPTEIARYVADGFTARLIREDLIKTEAALKAEKAKTAKFKALKPSVDGTRPLTADYTPPKEGERMSVDDRLRSIARAPAKT